MLDDYKCQYVSRIHKVQDYIEHNYWRNMSTKELSDVAGFSKYHFNRIFKSVLQESLSHYVNRVRMEYALFMLAHRKDRNISDIAYDLRFIELEKMKKLSLSKSLEQIYQTGIRAGWDYFCQIVAYLGINNSKGLFNSDKVLVTRINNTGTTGKGFEGLTDDVVVSFINGIFQSVLENSNMNIALMPDTILVPTWMQSDLVSRFSALYSNSLFDFIKEHNLGKAQGGSDFKLTIEARPDLDTLGGHGRIVADKKDKDYVRLDMPYPIQHYITLPNIEKGAYTSVFVGQVSEVQMPYNTNSNEQGVVMYFDFDTEA